MENDPPVNYIRHLSGAVERFSQDKRLNPSHVSLYLALFQFWNLNRFQNPVSINRAEIMKVSKIGSANTYTRCLKDLESFGYLQYSPSFNPFRGSLVHLYSFDNASGNGSDKASDKGAVIALRPSLNKEKQIKQVNRKEEFHKPALQTVLDHFAEKNLPEIEANKFFNHFESNGWLVGGKTPMKDWHAAARNWMINHRKFNAGSAPRSLNATTDKNYSEPL